MLSKILFLVISLNILITESIKYFFTNNYENYIINIADRLAKENIFYIKMFQAISTNTNLLTSELMAHLSKYTDHVPYTQDEINENLLQEINDSRLQILSNTPINSGTVALVFAGDLDGNPVIIKLIRKNIRMRLLTALENMQFILLFLSYLPCVKHLYIIEVFEENRTLMLNQLDFTKEVRWIETIGEINKNIDHFVIPRVYKEYTELNKNVIVMERLWGDTIRTISPDDMDDYCLLIAKFGLKSILYNRMYHADFHSGNMIFIKSNSGEKRLGIIDYGIIGEITKYEQNYFYEFFKKLFGDNVNSFDVAMCLLDNLVEPKELLNTIQPAILAKKLTPIIEEGLYIEKTLGPRELYYINKELANYDLKLARHFCKIGISLAISDSVCKKLSINKPYIDHIKSAMKSIFPSTMLDY